MTICSTFDKRKLQKYLSCCDKYNVRRKCEPQCPCIKKIDEVKSDLETVKANLNKADQSIENNYNYLTEQIGDLAELHAIDVRELRLYIDDKDAENDYLLEQEVNRATTAENDLSRRLQDEITRATLAESNLDNKIDDEITRATNAENDLDDKIDAEIARAADAEDDLDDKIDNEIIRATAAEGAIQDALDVLEAQHTSDINTLNNTIDNRINQLINGAPAALDTLGEIADQLRDDEDVVTALVATISHETSDRLNADSDLLTRLQAEITRSAGKDGEHDTSISQLATSVSDLQSDKADKVNMSAGTYTKVTVNGQGIVTAGQNPTTLAGYGITDANISNGTITLGSDTITPLTAHLDISGKADKSNTAAGTYTKLTVNNQGIVTNGENPTTLAGYGITDANISNGVITLGSDSITPLTSHQDISGKADKATTYTKTEVDNLLSALNVGNINTSITNILNRLQTLEGYWSVNVDNRLATSYVIEPAGYK